MLRFSVIYKLLDLAAIRHLMNTTSTERIILFDGICNLCNRAVQTVIRQDPEAKFSFASLQGSTGQILLKRYKLDNLQLNSFVLIKSGKAYTKSTAALQVAGELKGIIRLLKIFIIVPPFIRNGIYTLIARNRYRWFGKRAECMVPDPSIQKRFLP